MSAHVSQLALHLKHGVVFASLDAWGTTQETGPAVSLLQSLPEKFGSYFRYIYVEACEEIQT